MRRYQRPEALNQALIHLQKLIGHMQAYDRHALERVRELVFQPMVMAFFHHEDQIGPPQQPGRYPNPRPAFCPRRARLVAVVTIKYPFGRQAPPLVLTTDEEEFQG
jgi:hypothetical protein